MTSEEPVQIPTKTLKLYPTTVSAIETGHAGFVFTCSKSDNRLSLYDINSGDNIIDLDAPSQNPSKVAVSTDAAKAAFATSTGAVYVWDVMYPTSMESFRPEEDFVSPITCLSWHPRGHVLAVGTRTGHLHIWDMIVGTLLFLIPAHQGSISDIKWTANGRMLVSAGEQDSTLRVWNPRNTDNLAEITKESHESTDIKWHTSGITALDTLSDMSRVTITGDKDGSVLLSVLKPETMCGVFHQMQSHKASPVTAVRFASLKSPKPLRSASAAKDGSIHLFDMDRRLPMGKFIHKTGAVKQLQFSSNADTLFSAAGDTVMAWDARVAPDEEKPITYSTDSVNIEAFAFTNSEKNLVIAGDDGLVRTFDIRFPDGVVPDTRIDT